MDIKQEVAKKCRIKDILNGRYVKREGWESNYFETNFGKISVANIIAVVVSTQDNNLVVDDGTGMIQLRNFDQNKTFKEKIGDLVLIIGKPRSFNEQKYLVPKIIKKIDNPKWIDYRTIELKNQPIEKKEIKKEVTNENPVESTQIESVLKKIIELDKGNGVKISELSSFFDFEKLNKNINKLIEEGEIFEIKPGIVKSI